MSLPRKDFSGQEASVSMMELRASPGDIIDRAAHGMTIHILKNGIRVASIIPAETTIIKADGTIIGVAPLTLGRSL